MFAVDQDSDVVRARDFLHDVTDVGADAFLNLEAAGYGVCDAGDLGKSDDAAFRHISDGDFHIVHESDMVFAVGEDFNVLHDDHVAFR